MGSTQTFRKNIGVLGAYTLPALREATYGFAFAISRKLFVTRYGRGISNSLRFPQDFHPFRRAVDAGSFRSNQRASTSSFRPTGGTYVGLPTNTKSLGVRLT